MKRYFAVIFIIVYLAFLLVSFLFGFSSGKEIGEIFINYCLEMFNVLPCAFVLIGLFEVWVKREVVEKHLGKQAGFRGYIWAILLGGTTIGPMIVALPVAESLLKKRASLSVVFTYVGSAGVCRIPMTIFEVSYLGLPFTLIRYITSIPLIILSASLLGLYVGKKNILPVSEC